MSARLLFIASFNFADDYGGLDRSAKQLKAQAFPYDQIDCEPLIQELLQHGLMIEYSSGGKNYLHIKGFGKHQKVEKPAKPRIPLYEPSENPPRELPESSPPSKGLLGNGRDRKGEEGNGKEGRGGEQPSDFSIEKFPLEDPQSRRPESGERRNGDFERINDGVRKLIHEGGYTIDKPSAIAQALHCSEGQVVVAIRQLRDRGRLSS